MSMPFEKKYQVFIKTFDSFNNIIAKTVVKSLENTLFSSSNNDY